VQEVQGDHGDDQQQGGRLDQQPPTVLLQTHQVGTETFILFLTKIFLKFNISGFV
jgi:hypothetical protein